VTAGKVGSGVEALVLTIAWPLAAEAATWADEDHGRAHHARLWEAFCESLPAEEGHTDAG